MCFFRFADLHKAGSTFLSDNNIVTGPLKVSNVFRSVVSSLRERTEYFETSEKDKVYLQGSFGLLNQVFQVTDPTLPIQTRKRRSVAFRLTYTIYLVSTKGSTKSSICQRFEKYDHLSLFLDSFLQAICPYSVPAFPVADFIETARQMTLNSDNYNGKVTFLRIKFIAYIS